MAGLSPSQKGYITELAAYELADWEDAAQSDRILALAKWEKELPQVHELDLAPQLENSPTHFFKLRG